MPLPPAQLDPEHINFIRQKPLRYWIQCALDNYLSEVDPEFIHDVYAFVSKELDHALLTSILKHSRGNQSTAAKWLGLSRGTVRKKLMESGLEAYL